VPFPRPWLPGEISAALRVLADPPFFMPNRTNRAAQNHAHSCSINGMPWRMICHRRQVPALVVRARAGGEMRQFCASTMAAQARPRQFRGGGAVRWAIKQRPCSKSRGFGAPSLAEGFRLPVAEAAALACR